MVSPWFTISPSGLYARLRGPGVPGSGHQDAGTQRRANHGDTETRKKSPSCLCVPGSLWFIVSPWFPVCPGQATKTQGHNDGPTTETPEKEPLVPLCPWVSVVHGFSVVHDLAVQAPRTSSGSRCSRVRPPRHRNTTTGQPRRHRKKSRSCLCVPGSLWFMASRWFTISPSGLYARLRGPGVPASGHRGTETQRRPTTETPEKEPLVPLCPWASVVHGFSVVHGLSVTSSVPRCSQTASANESRKRSKNQYAPRNRTTEPAPRPRSQRQ